MEQFLKLAQARDVVQIRIGEDLTVLVGERLDAIKEFCSYLGAPFIKISSPASNSSIKLARSLEAMGLDDEARNAYQSILERYADTYEASEATKAMKRLDDPARVQAYAVQKQAASVAKARKAKEAEEKKVRAKIELDLRLGKNLEETNRKAALSYYKEILKLANGLNPEPAEAKAARSRLKAFEAKE